MLWVHPRQRLRGASNTTKAFLGAYATAKAAHRLLTFAASDLTRVGPQVDAALDGVPVDLGQLIG